MDLTWLLTEFDAETDELVEVYRLENLGAKEVKNYIRGAGADDPLYDTYPIDSPELLSWIGDKVDGVIQPDRFAYLIEQATERAYRRMCEQVRERG